VLVSSAFVIGADEAQIHVGDLPTAVSAILHTASHVPSIVLPVLIVCAVTLAARRVAIKMQTTPLANKTMIAVFCVRGIWRFHVRGKGNTMTRDHQ